MSDPKYLVMGGVASAAGACLLQIVAVATTGWADLYVPASGDFDTGLFKLCRLGQCVEYDYVILVDSDLMSTLRAIRALIIIGLLGAFGGTALGVLTYLKPNAGIKLYLFAFIALIISDIFPIIGSVVFRTQFINDLGFTSYSYSLGYSYFLSIIGSVAGWIGGVLVFLGGKQMATYSSI